eukprot:TRINITY_DN10118_c0_g1_i2.p1 TRINITY_DN10118_c0_g1~~TRINITY_DN10118_c0_g1_i2.p1  ORF type:complete len:480 (+),score=179.79 TRINITY_DN10118_c0_g1_i2:199-1440(+)
MSGIMSIFVAGRLFKRWVVPNLSVANRLFVPRLSKAIAETAELYVFAFLGCAAWGYAECLNWDVWFIVATFIFILLGRAANIFPLCALSNLLRDEGGAPITFHQQVFMWFSGLRGAIAFALACYGTNSGTLKNGDLLVTTTLVTVMLTVFIFGGLAKPMLTFLKLAPPKGASAAPPTGRSFPDSERTTSSGEGVHNALDSRLIAPDDDGADLVRPLDSDMEEDVGAEHDPPPVFDPASPRNQTWFRKKWLGFRFGLWRVSASLVAGETRFLKPLICIAPNGQDRKREKLCAKLIKEGVDHGPFLDTLTDRTLRHIVVSAPPRNPASPLAMTGYGPGAAAAGGGFAADTSSEAVAVEMVDDSLPRVSSSGSGGQQRRPSKDAQGGAAGASRSRSAPSPRQVPAAASKAPMAKDH